MHQPHPTTSPTHDWTKTKIAGQPAEDPCDAAEILQGGGFYATPLTSIIPPFPRCSTIHTKSHINYVRFTYPFALGPINIGYTRSAEEKEG